MPEIKLDSMPFGYTSVDDKFEIVGGQVGIYKEDGVLKAIRRSCNREAGNCPALKDGLWVVQSYDNDTGDPCEFGIPVECGKTEEGLKKLNEIF